MQPLNLVMGTTKYDECTLQSISHFNGCNLNFSDKEKALYSRSDSIINSMQISRLCGG